ncbi:hypothetical protein pb186bvf_014297 [Paramecium bursaria]
MQQKNISQENKEKNILKQKVLLKRKKTLLINIINEYITSQYPNSSAYEIIILVYTRLIGQFTTIQMVNLMNGDLFRSIDVGWLMNERYKWRIVSEYLGQQKDFFYQQSVISFLNLITTISKIQIKGRENNKHGQVSSQNENVEIRHYYNLHFKIRKKIKILYLEISKIRIVQKSLFQQLFFKTQLNTSIIFNQYYDIYLESQYYQI